jgi:hypothetical protein
MDTGHHPAQNSTEISTRRLPGRPFEKGRSGNPGGRPKGLARQVRELLGDDGEVIARFWAAIMADEKAHVRDRLVASRLLAERGWGKPPQFAPIEDDDPLDLANREAEIVASLDARLDELAARRAGPRNELGFNDKNVGE